MSGAICKYLKNIHYHPNLLLFLNNTSNIYVLFTLAWWVQCIYTMWYVALSLLKKGSSFMRGETREREREMRIWFQQLLRLLLYFSFSYPFWDRFLEKHLVAWQTLSRVHYDMFRNSRKLIILDRKMRLKLIKFKMPTLKYPVFGEQSDFKSYLGSEWYLSSAFCTNGFSTMFFSITFWKCCVSSGELVEVFGVKFPETEYG